MDSLPTELSGKPHLSIVDFIGFPSGSAVKNLPANIGDTRDLGSVPGLGRSPGIGKGNPVFLPGESHGQRSLASYSP